ncbi:lysis protein [Vibrio cholerae]|uniref:lysis protein n=1 Tax=Vibrio cholerae TaxID=666 RepID=UPI001C92065D|nr:lysis protein [Vibrio cholerae]MBY3671881.1 lysis protein [Vibrio cholerae]
MALLALFLSERAERLKTQGDLAVAVSERDNITLERDALLDVIHQQKGKIDEYSRLSKATADELKKAKDEVNSLGDTLRDQRKRLLVKASCPPAMPSADIAGSVGDAGTARLSDTAREDYLRLRMMMVENEKQTKYLQDYIKTQCIR